MIEDLLTAVKEKDTKIRKIEQEHVQIQNDLIIKNMKLLQEREETYRSLTNRNKQIDEYKYNINDMTMKLEKLKHEIIFNEDKLYEENEMLKSKIKQENINYNLKIDGLQTEKEKLFHENDMLKRIIEEKDVNLNILLKQETETHKTLNQEKCDMEKAFDKMSQDFRELLLINEKLEIDLQQSEDKTTKFREKEKNQSSKHKENINKLELQITKLQKENCLKSHKINFLLEKIKNDCEKWDHIERDLKIEISNLTQSLDENKKLLNKKDEAIIKMRSHQNDRAASLIEAVRSYVGENNFNNLNIENSNLSSCTTAPTATIKGGARLVRTMSTLDLRNGIVEREANNNNDLCMEENLDKHLQTQENLETGGESIDTDVSQNSFNSSENAE